MACTRVKSEQALDCANVDFMVTVWSCTQCAVTGGREVKDAGNFLYSYFLLLWIYNYFKIKRKKRDVESYKAEKHHSQPISRKTGKSASPSTPLHFSREGQSNLHLIYSPFLTHLLLKKKKRKQKPKAVMSPQYT